MSYIGNQPTSVAFLTDQFSGTGSQTAFTLSAAPANTASIIVAVSGVLQDPTTYSTAGLTLTFSAAPPSGTGNVSVRFLGIPASNIATTAYRTQTEFTATANQTTFSVPSYTVGYIDVYRNGALLGSADFTATNGTTVVLANGASEGDLVETVSFYVSSVLNAIPNTAGSVSSANLTNGSVTQAKLSTNVAGNGPAFSYYQTSTQSLPAATNTKLLFQTSTYDTTGGMFASSRFTPTVAGYYLFTSAYQAATTASDLRIALYKNGALFINITPSSTGTLNWVSGSGMAFCNGTTDYIEMWGYSGAANTTNAVQQSTWFQGAMVRSA